MIYKGQELSDNLTLSQINMFKQYIDQGFTIKDILAMYVDPDNIINESELENDKKTS
jgi:hypothetical protein